MGRRPGARFPAVPSAFRPRKSANGTARHAGLQPSLPRGQMALGSLTPRASVSAHSCQAWPSQCHPAAAWCHPSVSQVSSQSYPGAMRNPGATLSHRRGAPWQICVPAETTNFHCTFFPGEELLCGLCHPPVLLPSTCVTSRCRTRSYLESCFAVPPSIMALLALSTAPGCPPSQAAVPAVLFLVTFSYFTSTLCTFSAPAA